MPLTSVDLPRRIVLDGAANVRDLGGYATADGRQVRFGLLYRADSLHRITATDVDRLHALGLRTVIDLRSTDEINRSGALLSDRVGVGYEHLEIRNSRVRRDQSVTDGIGTMDLGALYRRFLEVNGSQLAAALRLIAEPERVPVLFHCFAGKDRTGILAAVVLSLLGVEDEDVARDYAATATSFARFLDLARSDDPPILDLDNLRSFDPSLLEARAETMVDLLDEVRSDVGSVAALAQRWGFGPDAVAQLRSSLLDPA